VLLALHLLAMNVASAGPLVCVWLEWKERQGDALAGRTATWLGTTAFVTLLVGGLLGLALGGLHWSAVYARLWTHTLAYKAAWGLGEYVFSLLFTGGYALWRHRFPDGHGAQRGRGWRQLLLVLSGTNLLYHFPFLFSVAANVYYSHATTPPISPPDFRRWMVQGDILARVVHVVLASFAVTGVMLLGLAVRRSRQAVAGSSDAGAEAKYEAGRLARWGGGLALVPTLLQIPVGLWIVASLPTDWQARVLGGDLVATGLLGLSVMLSLFLLQDLATIAFGEAERKQAIRAMGLMFLIVLFMTGVLRLMRDKPAPRDAAAAIDLRDGS
jgi:hypothetical protein